MRRYTIWICTPGKILPGWSIKENEMDRTCAWYGEKRVRTKIHTVIRLGNLKKRGHLEDLPRRWMDNIDVAKQTGWDNFYCVHLSQHRPKRWALLRPMKCVERLAEDLPASLGGLCSMICFIYFLRQIWKEHTRIHAQGNMSCVSKVCNCYTRYLEGKSSHHVFNCVCVIQPESQR
jgi:hypothetical protein